MADSNDGWRLAGELGEMGLRLALFLLLCVWGGWKLDRHFGWSPWLTLAGVAVGLGIGMTWLIVRLKEFTEKPDK